MWMEVISRMERSIDACLVANDGDVRALEFWDSSVAFYTGSQARSGDDSGVFLFHLANDRCLSAKTCGEKGNGADGTAWVNIQVLDLFQLGQGQINARNCEAARNTKEEIVRLMTIPLVQGALRRARLIEDEGFTNERHVAEGAAFAAAVLPIVHDCSIEDAGIIHENLSAGPSLIVDFDAVRDAFGRNLDCIDITCEEVGSDLDLDVNDDFCRLARGEIDSLIVGLAEEEGPSASAGQIILYVILSVIASILCCLTFHCMGNRKDQREIENPSIYRDTVKESELGNDSIVSSKNAVETVITGAEYAPKYWKDGHQSEGDNIEGEVL